MYSNLLQAVCTAATEFGVQLKAVQKANEEDGYNHSMVDQVEDNQAVLQALVNGNANVAAGTAWLWAREEMSKSIDVLFVDEAGQIGGRQMLELLRLACENNARVMLSGDTRQHGAVEASDALLAIERHSGVKPVELHKIRRQDPALGRDDDERIGIRRVAPVRLCDGFVGRRLGSATTKRSGDRHEIEPVILVGY